MTSKQHTKFIGLLHRLAISWLAVVIVLQTGCITLSTAPNTQYQTSLGQVAVISRPQIPEIQFEGFAHSKGEGAATGAGSAFLACIDTFTDGSCSGEICGAIAILMVGACGVTSAVGGVVGALAAPDADEVQSAEGSLSTALNAKAIQKSLLNKIEEVALARDYPLVSVSPESIQSAAQLNDYRPFAKSGVDTLLDVALTEVGAIGDGIDSPLLLRMQAHARLIRTSDNSEIFSTDYFYIGQKVRLAEWSANGSERLLNDLQNGYQILAAHIFDSVFLLYPFPDRQPHWSGFLSSAFGLAPIYPPTRGQVTPDPMTGDPISGSSFAWTSVDSLRPTLRWQEFPRASDLKVAPQEMGRVDKVRYDLVVAREQDLAPAEITYHREALADTAHTIEYSLSPDTRYYWTVRARFELDGRERVTEWGSTHYKVREQWTAPSLLSYRFKTPK